MKNTITIPTIPASRLDNFSTLNYKEIDIGENKIAWTFFQVTINQEYGQLGSNKYPQYFYIRTQSGTMYKIFPKTYKYLQEICSLEKSTQIMETFPMERCIYNPKTRKVIGVEEFTLRSGEPFVYAKGCTTSAIKEIIGVSSSMSMEKAPVRLASSIQQDFQKIK